VDLLLIRHGLPLRVERDDGRPADPPLSDRGRAQAERVARWLAHERIDHIVSSPLQRARQTAEPLARALGLEVEIESRVAEFDRDSAHYIPLEELKRIDYPAWKAFMETGYGDGVPIGTFVAEVEDALGQCIAHHRGRRVAVFCHGGVINVFAARVMGIARPLFFQPDYTSINRFAAASSGERSVVALNETAHLEASRRLGKASRGPEPPDGDR
jgi:probable phosphoglycerate mutase